MTSPDPDFWPKDVPFPWPSEPSPTPADVFPDLWPSDPTGDTSSGSDTSSRDFATEARLLAPWLPPELLDVFVEAYVEYGDPDLAMAAVRNDSRYDTYFAGNRRDDGSLRLTEMAYQSTIEGYQDVLNSIGVNPDLFQAKYGQLISGDVTVDEFATERIYPVYDRILSAGPAVLDEYNRLNGVSLTEEGLVAAMLDPDLEERILQKKITMAEIGGEAIERGFELARDTAEMLFQQGVDQRRAEATFGVAANVLPTLNVLASRHADPDDDFDLSEFLQADIFDDPTQRARMRRLVAQERSMFANAAGAGIPYRSDQSGRLLGLKPL